MSTQTRRWVYLFFFLSGATALVYEIVWVRLLGLVFGNTTYAISTVLAAFMAGLGLGSYFVGALADRWKNHLRTYGLLELGIGAYSALTFLLIKFIETAYVSAASPAHPNTVGLIALRVALSSVIIFVPTFFMGATLPVLAKFCIERDEMIGPRTALLYGLNTAGAVVGTLLTGFWLLPHLGLHLTLAGAIAVNLAIGLIAFLLSNKTDVTESPNEPIQEIKFSWILAGIFASGVTAMIYEIGWTRTLAIVLGSSTYAFTLMLATFLLGMAAGSAVYERILRRRQARTSDWAWLQMTIAIFTLFSLPLYPRVPLWMVRFFALSIDHPGLLDWIRFKICGALMFVPAFSFGALFPVSVSLFTQNHRTVGRGVGTLYLSNTFGNILGSLATGFLLIPRFGIHETLLMASIASGILGLGAFLGARRNSRLTAAALAGLFLIGGVWLNRRGWDPRLVTSGLHIRPRSYVTKSSAEILSGLYETEVLFYREGLNSIVSVGKVGDHRFLKVNGKTDASTGKDMATQLLSGHLPHLLHPDPKRTLVIGFGSGTTIAASLAYPIESLDGIEIEQGVLQAAPYFDSINRKSYKDPRVRLVANDGRNHLLLEKKPYDVIISEPSNPWMSGTSYLFTVEFYEKVSAHLTQGGIFCQWLQAYSISPADFRMVVASVQKVFPHVTIWQSMPGDELILASKDPIVLDLSRVKEAMKRSPLIGEDLGSIGITGPAGILSYFRLGEGDVRRYAEGAPLNTDDRLLLEFNAPKSLYLQGTSDKILHILRKQATEAFTIEGSYDNAVEMAEGYLAQEVEENRARDYFVKALEIKPNDARSLLGIGLAYYKERHYQKSLEMFNKALLVKETPEALYWKKRVESILSY